PQRLRDPDHAPPGWLCLLRRDRLMASLVPLRGPGRPRRRAASLTGRLAALIRAGGLALPTELVDALAGAWSAGPVSPASPGEVYQALLARHDRRARGTFYSPPHLIDLALDRALGPALGPVGQRPGSRRILRVLDPACGAGAFLVAALGRLEAHAVAAGARAGIALRARLCRSLTGIDRDPLAADL